MPKYKIKCACCGKEFNLCDYNQSHRLFNSIFESKTCFDCTYWKQFISSPTPRSIIVSGQAVVATPIYDIFTKSKCKSPQFLYVMDLKSYDAAILFTYRFIGRIPDNFKDILPDEYKFISFDTYWIAKRYRGTQCQAKGCWDRYKCFWYNASNTEKHKVWNNAHNKRYYPGIEGCESFVNKETMYNITT